jgi:hypothetical protein
MRFDDLIESIGNSAFFLRDRLFKMRSTVRGMAPTGGARPSRRSAIEHLASAKRWFAGGSATALVRQHQWALCALVIGGIGLATVPGALRASDAPVVTKPAPLWFYDLGTEKLFAGPADALAPIAAPSGGADAGMRAHVFSCGSCGDPLQTRIGFLEKQSDAAKQAWQTLKASRDLPKDQRDKLVATIHEGTFVGPVSGKDWYALQSVNGGKVVRAARTPCDNGQPLSECDPLSP